MSAPRLVVSGASAPRIPQCRCGDLLVIYRRVMPRDVRGDEWRPRMDLHHQPPDSKSGAPLIELQGWKWSRLPVLPRSDLVYRTSAWLLCQAGGKWRKPEVMLPILRSRTIRIRGGPGALVRFSFHVGIGESPRCCPVLRGLRDRCIAAMLATQKRKSVDMLHKLRLQLRPVSNRRRHARPL